MPKKLKKYSNPYKDSHSPMAISGERDACGVGFVAHIDGIESNWILKESLRGLDCMEHRGGCGGDSDSGDGAGVLCSIPWTYLSKHSDLEIDNTNKIGLGMIFMPQNESLIKAIKVICEKEASNLNFYKTMWREVPVDINVLGPLAKANAPFIIQWLVSFEKNIENFEFLLFQLRKKIEKKVRQNLPNQDDFYFASFSSKTIVYKGMVRSEILPKFYKDLQNEDFKVSYSVYHRRFSTNTLPKWPLAQPMRFLGHNGEINTLLGNINWAKASEKHIDSFWGDLAKDLKPIVDNTRSDSANLDATLEIYLRSGQPVTDSLLKLVPEAFRDQPELDDKEEIQCFYEYSASLQEAWDGPALIAFSDGNFIGATLDRNGLRPARYSITNDGFVVMGSETGVVNLDESKIIEKED